MYNINMSSSMRQPACSHFLKLRIKLNIWESLLSISLLVALSLGVINMCRVNLDMRNLNTDW